MPLFGSRTNGNTPVPDPSVLTTQQLRHELQALSERTDLLFDGLRQTIGARLDAMDKAVRVFESNLTRVPTDIDKQIECLKELHEEKFHSVDTQFLERDVRVEQTARDTRVAVDAALQAAEKAVGKQNDSFALAIAKSEAATAKQIDQQGSLIQTTSNGLNDKVTDIKDRLTLIEGRGVGQTVAETTHQTSSGLVINLIIGIAAIFSVMLSAGALLYTLSSHTVSVVGK